MSKHINKGGQEIVELYAFELGVSPIRLMLKAKSSIWGYESISKSDKISPALYSKLEKLLGTNFESKDKLDSIKEHIEIVNNVDYNKVRHARIDKNIALSTAATKIHISKQRLERFEKGEDIGLTYENYVNMTNFFGDIQKDKDKDKGKNYVYKQTHIGIDKVNGVWTTVKRYTKVEI